MDTTPARRQGSSGSWQHAILLFLLLSSVTLAQLPAAVASTRAAAAARTRAAAAAGDSFAYLAFVNDVHNRLEEEEPLTATPCQPATKALGRCVGGWPRISSQIKALRLQAAKEGAGFFFLDAGDEFTGSLWDVVYKGQFTAQVQNLVRPDVMTLGNHETDFGLQLLARYIGNLTMPMLGACNVDASQEPALQGLLKKWTVLRYGGFKIGVLGWLTPDTAVTSLNTGKLQFAPITPALTACLKELRQAHADLDYVVGLSHAGYSSDLETARQVPGLDVIIGGHSHTFLFTPTTAGPIVTRKPGVNASNCVALSACDKPAGPFPTMVGDVPVVQAYYSSKYLGVLKVNLSKRSLVSARLLLLGGANSSNHVQQDPKVLALLRQHDQPVQQLRTQVTGRTLVPLQGDAVVSRVNETNLGNLVCEAFLAAVPAKVAADVGGAVSVCLMNAGGIRSGFPKPGNITVGDVMTMLPYANAFSIFSISGASLTAALKHGLTAYPSGGRFLQVSGVRYLHRDGVFLSAMLLSADGSTRPIEPSRNYTIIATDYMLQGGDGFQFSAADVLLPAGQPYQEAVSDYLKAVLPAGVSPTTHNRIINCASTPAFPGCPPAPSKTTQAASSAAASGSRVVQEQLSSTPSSADADAPATLRRLLSASSHWLLSCLRR